MSFTGVVWSTSMGRSWAARPCLVAGVERRNQAHIRREEPSFADGRVARSERPHGTAGHCRTRLSGRPIGQLRR
jgi:hypothetical protein